MIDISPAALTLFMLGGLMVGVLLGYPIAVPIGALTAIAGYLLLGGSAFELIYGRLFSFFMSYTLLAVPLFVFMGTMLERSGIAESMYNAFYLFLSGFRGGLAVMTVILGTILAACVGIIGASVTMLSLLALPAMISRGYSKSLAAGSVCAGGSLGTLIPPSIMLVIYGPMAGISVGRLFFGAIVPGLVLSGLYCAYIVIRASLQPRIAPAISMDERSRLPFTRRLVVLLRALVPPMALILSVLGVIFFGIAPPTEAAAVGALVATLLTVFRGQLRWRTLKDTALQTVKVTSMILLIGGMSYAFVGVFLAGGAGRVIEEVILGFPGGRWGAFVGIMSTVFILGFFIDMVGIIFIIVPIISPLIPALGFDPLWFGILIVVNLQMSYMTPPFASAIFYVRAAAPVELGVTTGDIIRGITPFVFLIMVGIVICVAFPQLILWLPNIMVR